MAERVAPNAGFIRGLPGCSPRLVLLVGLLFALNSVIGSVVAMGDQLVSGQTLWMIDFPSFHMAADSVFNRGLSPYAESTQALYALEHGFPVLPFLYPPYALPLLYPLSLLDYSAALLVFLAANAAVSLILFYLLHQLFLADVSNPAAYWAAVVFLFFCGSVRETVGVGQVNLIAALVLLLAWRLLRDARHLVLAGALIGIAVVTKTYFLLLLMLFLPRLEWRPMLGAAGVVTAFSFLALGMAPASLWGEWLSDVAPSARFGTSLFREFPVIVAANQSINGILIRIIGEGAASFTLGTASAAAVIAAAAVALWLRRREEPGLDFEAGLPLVLLTVFLTAPLSWPHHLVFVTPAVLSLWSDAARRGARQEMMAVGVLAVWAEAPWPLIDFLHLSPHLTFLPFPGIAALWLLSLRHAARRPDSVPSITRETPSPAP